MKKVYMLLFLIFLVASYLRFNNLANNPVGFHIDEASLGYNAYSLLLTGKDFHGNKWPLYISVFNDNNPSGYYYMAMLPIKFFGLNEFATRFPAALFGSLSIFAIYFLAHAIFRDNKISIISALLLAISPWNIVLSRISAETLVALFFVMLGFVFIINYLNNKLQIQLILGTLSLFLSLFIYPSPRIFVPVFYLLLLLILIPSIYKKISLKRIFSILASFLIITITSFSLIFMVSGGTARFSQVSIFNFPETKLIQEEQIREDGVSGTSIAETRSSHNKLSNYFLTFTSNYFEYFTGNFLFTKGGYPPLLKIPGIGLIYLIELPFILFGIILLITNKKLNYKIPLLWLVIAPVAAALTVDDIPNVRRAIAMFPAIELIAAFGFIKLSSKLKGITRFFFISCLIILMFVNFMYFFHQYNIHAKLNKPWYRNESYGKMAGEIKKSYHQYEKIIVSKSTGGYPLMLFFMQYNPELYQQENSPGDTDYKGFGKFIFVPQDCPSENEIPQLAKYKHVMFINKGECTNRIKNTFSKKPIYILREDGTKAFNIVYD